MKRTVFLSVLADILNLAPVSAQKEKGSNPVIYADVPDISMVRVGNAYYMSSTTMHMAPGVPVMKSTDLTNWKLVSYCYDVLEPTDEMSLNHGKTPTEPARGPAAYGIITGGSTYPPFPTPRGKPTSTPRPTSKTAHGRRSASAPPTTTIRCFSTTTGIPISSGAAESSTS